MSVAAQFDRWRWWYDGIIDWMIANPDATLQECGKALGKAPSTISLITNSDIFKARLAERRKDFTARHDESIIRKTTLIAELALDGLRDKLEKKRDTLPVNQLIDISEKQLSRLGYGLSPEQKHGVSINIGAVNPQVVQVSRDQLAEARSSLRAIEKKRVEDAEVVGGPLDILEGAAVAAPPQEKAPSGESGGTVEPLDGESQK